METTMQLSSPAHYILSDDNIITAVALKQAQESLLSENIMIASANASNPGLPPSSLMTFLEKNPAISGVFLKDFDSVFVNKFYHSHLDDLSNVNSSAVVAAASLIARTLYILTSGCYKCNVSLVEDLMGCLLDCDPGLVNWCYHERSWSCELEDLNLSKPLCWRYHEPTFIYTLYKIH
ncbi:Nicastrin, partial [Mucuna pruriens]